MKFYLNNLFYSVVLFLSIVSCKDDDSMNDPTPTPIPTRDPPTSDVISAILPQHGATNQDVFINPLIIFKYKVEEVVQFSNNPSNYKLVLDEAKLLTTTEFESTLEWTTNKDSLVLIPKTVLSPQTTYTIYVKTHWEEEKINGSWEPVKLNDLIQFQISEKTFTTENIDISRILLDNIKFTYPIAYQYHFLKSEYPQGYVSLKTSMQNYLFEVSSGATQYQFKARFSSPGQSNIEVPLIFDQATLTLNHDIPSNLIHETIYKLQYLKIPDGDGTEQELYAIYFRTSKYNTFLEKIDSYTLSNTFSWETDIGATELSMKLLNQTEYFDYMEANVDSVYFTGSKGIYFSIGLIQFEALTGNTWYDENIYPLLYKDLSASGLPWQRSNLNLEVPPVNGIYIRRANSYSSNFSSFRKLTEDEIKNNQSTSITDQATLIYNMGPFTAFDYLKLSALAANAANPNEYTQNLKSTSYPNLTFGTYQVKMKYVLPGKSAANSEKTLSFIYN